MGQEHGANEKMEQMEPPWDKNMKKKRKRIHRPVRLRCSVKNYDWGIFGRNSKVARLFALNSGSDIDSGRPYAEFWIGTHESGPSYADSRSEPLSLKAWISQDPSVLGDKVVDKWGADLPFLFKVLSVGKALSIQAHPDKELATVLHKLHPSVYRDDNHKPEMALALTEFEALCGFISVKELKDMLNSVPEIAELVVVADAGRILLGSGDHHHENGKAKTDIESVFTRLMLLSKDTIADMISRLKRRLNLEKKKRLLTVKEQLVLRLESQYPDDVGAIAAFFLNYVKLNRGEAISLGPNEPHAYISGECIECMATSDNVVRAGLTSKPLDVQTLLSMLKYRQGSPEIMQGVSLNPYTTRYLPPFEEFEVDCCNIPRSASVVFPSVLGPSLFLFTAGKGHFDAGLPEDDMVVDGDDLVEEGEVFFVPANTKISITAKSTELQLYRVGVNSRFFRDL